MLLERTRRLGEAAMTFMPEIKDRDVELVQNAMSEMPNSTSVAEFVPGPGIAKLDLKFDIKKLQEALEECLTR